MQDPAGGIVRSIYVLIGTIRKSFSAFSVCASFVVLMPREMLSAIHLIKSALLCLQTFPLKQVPALSLLEKYVAELQSFITKR